MDNVPHSPPPKPLSAIQLGDKEAIGKLLESHRHFLLQVAAAELDQRLRRKAGDSDLVQQTLLEAGQAIANFDGDSMDALAAWLKKILLNNIANLRRAYLTDKRNIFREVVFSGDSSSGLKLDSMAVSRPEAESSLESQEQRQIMTAAFAALAVEYQQVIRLRSEENLTFAEIGTLMNRSADATRKLWARGVEAFKAEIERISLG